MRGNHAETMRLSRRQLLCGMVALGTAAAWPGALAAAPFASARLSVTVSGSGPDVILIHGVDSSRSIWNAMVKAVPGHRYHLVQIAGFSGVPAGGNARGAVVAPVADEIARYIAEARLIRPAVIGHSMGGTIALMLASRYPAPIGKAMVVDMLPAPAGFVGASARGIRPMADGLRNLTDSAEGRRLVDSVMGLFGGQSNPARRSDSGVTARALHDLATTDLTAALPKMTTPLTVVYATPSKTQTIDPARIVRAYQAAYRGAKRARLVPIANAGHMIMFDQPAAFHAAVRMFLAAR